MTATPDTMKSLNRLFRFVIVLAVVAAGCARQAAPRQDSTVANDFAVTELSPSAVIGRLGKPLGEREVIVGFLVEILCSRIHWPYRKLMEQPSNP